MIAHLRRWGQIKLAGIISREPEASVSIPEDSKILFEKLNLSEDLSGSLEPIAEESPEQALPQQEPEAEAKTEQAPVAAEEEKSEQAEANAGEEAAVPAPSKYKVLLERLSSADPFNVLLAMTVAALLIAILCCLVELGRYGFDVGAKKARSTVSMTAPIDTTRSIC